MMASTTARKVTTVYAYASLRDCSLGTIPILLLAKDLYLHHMEECLLTMSFTAKNSIIMPKDPERCSRVIPA
jgi:hypothetical protein